MGTVLALLGLWLVSGFAVALIFGHLADRAAIRSPALERALRELTGVRATDRSTKSVLAAAVAVSMAVVVLVGLQVQTTERPASPRAFAPSRQEPRRPPAREAPAAQRPATRSRTTQTPLVTRRSATASAPAVTGALVGKRAAKLVAALGGSLGAEAFATGLRQPGHVTRSPRVKHAKRHATAVRIGHVKKHRR